jgi:hypothetical protein
VYKAVNYNWLLGIKCSILAIFLLGQYFPNWAEEITIANNHCISYYEHRKLTVFVSFFCINIFYPLEETKTLGIYIFLISIPALWYFYQHFKSPFEKNVIALDFTLTMKSKPKKDFSERQLKVGFLKYESPWVNFYSIFHNRYSRWSYSCWYSVSFLYLSQNFIFWLKPPFFNTFSILL